MKTTNLFATLSILLAGCFINPANAQVDVTLAPFGLIFKNFGATVDLGLSENFSIEGRASYGFGDIDDFKFKSLPVTVLGKYYFSPKNGADGFYANGFLRFVKRSYEFDDSSDSSTVYANYDATKFGIGAGIGYKLVSDKGLVFEIGTGAGRSLWSKRVFESEGEEFAASWNDLLFYFKVGIGYRFGAKDSGGR